jgi:hypothetical protein
MRITVDDRPTVWRVTVIVVENPLIPQGRIDVTREIPETITAEQHPASAATVAFYSTCKIAVDAGWGIANTVVLLECQEMDGTWTIVKEKRWSLSNGKAVLESLLVTKGA